MEYSTQCSREKINVATGLFLSAQESCELDAFWTKRITYWWASFAMTRRRTAHTQNQTCTCSDTDYTQKIAKTVLQCRPETAKQTKRKLSLDGRGTCRWIDRTAFSAADRNPKRKGKFRSTLLSLFLSEWSVKVDCNLMTIRRQPVVTEKPKRQITGMDTHI